MGPKKAVPGRKSHGAVQAVPRIRPGRGRQPCGQRGTGRDCPQNLRPFPAGKDTICDCSAVDRGGHPDTRWEKELGQKDGREHPYKRKIQRRRLTTEGLHYGLPHKEEKEERGRGAAVLCGRKPRGNHPSRTVRQGAEGDATPIR